MGSPIVNLDTCAREPIHIPGAIQPHGVLFVLREPDLTVVQVSDNVTEYLGVPEDRILNHDISAFLDPEQRERVKFALDSVDPRDNNPVDLQLMSKNDRGYLDGFVHRHDGFSFLEIESAAVATNARFLDFYKVTSRLSSRLHATPDLQSLLDEAARGIREITGFERVMIYRFSESFEGEVIAEARADHADSFQGLWFPASDIPEQARRLYVLNPIRSIADSIYTPCPIVPAINPETRRPVDLSFASLRSVSPIHCEYLQNMGVRASMSISILRAGKLWGLVVCHHSTPKIVPYELRRACTFIGEMLSSEIARREVEGEATYQSKTTLTMARLLELMATSSNPLLGLIQSSPNLLDLVPASGAAVIEGGKANMLGSTPGYEDIMQLMGLLENTRPGSTFVTRSLKNTIPISDSLRSLASGLIALHIDRNPATYVMFFRPERAETVSWGGNPNKPAIADEDGFRLSPRKSFEAWREEVLGYAEPWNPTEIRAASELRNLIGVVTYSRGT